MIIAFLAAALVQAQPADRTYEGDWFVSDQTDNNTGERTVYAFRLHVKKDDPDFVTVTMRCSNGKPTLFVEWEDVAFPDQAILTIGPVAGPDAEPVEQPYMFEKSDDSIERGMRASPETSARIVTALGQSKYAIFSAHLSSGTRHVGIDVDGTRRAWDRVSRHCPIQILPRPPL